jgi:CpXC protein
MSYLTDQEIPCQHCQFPNTVDVWSAVNVREDPELKDLLLGGELNMAECSSCKKVFHAEHFLLYHDPDAEFMAFVYPYVYRDERPFYEEKTKADFGKLQESLDANKRIAYQPFTLFGLDQLVEWVTWDDEARIQSEIMALLAREKGLSTRKIRSSFAFAHRLPFVLPFTPKETKSLSASSVAAIGEIEKVNDRLTLYGDAKNFLLKNPVLEFEFEPLEKNKN